MLRSSEPRFNSLNVSYVALIDSCKKSVIEWAHNGAIMIGLGTESIPIGEIPKTKASLAVCVRPEYIYS